MILDRAVDFIWIFGAMVLVGSALVGRRHLPHGPRLIMVLAWIVIFAILFAAAHWIDIRR